MTTASIFTLVVRLSGFFTAFAGAHALVGSVFGYHPFWSRNLLIGFLYLAFGYVIMITAPLITEISGAEES